LGLVIDSLLARNPIDASGESQSAKPGKGDHISVRLRPGDGTRLRERARARGMNHTTYAALLIRSHLFTNPPMPLRELSLLESGLAQVSAIAGSLNQIARVVRHKEGSIRSLRRSSPQCCRRWRVCGSRCGNSSKPTC
jgi:hypothetical protein